MEKIVAYCRRIADNLERFHHDFTAFETDYLFQDACCTALNATDVVMSTGQRVPVSRASMAALKRAYIEFLF